MVFNENDKAVIQACWTKKDGELEKLLGVFIQRIESGVGGSINQ